MNKNMTDNNQNPQSDDEDISMDDFQKEINKLKEEDGEKEIKIEENENSRDDDSSRLEEDNEIIDDNENKVEELTNALARSMADLQNYKRRVQEDRIKLIKFANTDLLQKLIPIMDHFDRSAKHLPEELKENDWVKGVIQVHDELLKTLENVGIKKIKTIGEIFNPNLHEALMQGEGEKDIITEEFEAGYIYNEETLKAAKVKVGNGK